MFAEIVPEELRSTVYAFDRSFEGGVAACAAPLVGKATVEGVHHTQWACISGWHACIPFFADAMSRDSG